MKGKATSAIAREARRLVDEIPADPSTWDAKLKEAEKVLRGGLEKHPDDAVLLTCLATVLSDQGHHRKAVSILKELVEERGVTDANAYFNLGVAMTNCNDLRGKALTWFRKADAFEEHPETWQAYFDPHGT